MKKISLKQYYIIIACISAALCAYPIYMGVFCVVKMCSLGYVPAEVYPKYVIPYTPIALSIVAAVCLLPFALKYACRAAAALCALLPLAVFFLSESLMEKKIIVLEKELYITQSWQLSLCYVPPDMYKTRTWQAVDVLLGGYKPYFKIHFYLISVVLILAVVGVFYGFGKMVKSSDEKRKRALIIQSVCTALFLGMCIWACFTSFYRSGEMTVGMLSAVLMCAFFVILGMTAGLFVGSLLLGKSKLQSVLIPALLASLTVVAMYVGEMLMLHFEVYRFGQGFFFNALPLIALAPIDLCMIALAGIGAGAILHCLNAKVD